jgi:hypothetical protein
MSNQKKLEQFQKLADDLFLQITAFHKDGNFVGVVCMRFVDPEVQMAIDEIGKVLNQLHGIKEQYDEN